MTSMTRGLVWAALVCCLPTPSSHAENIVSGNLFITQPWSRATPGGAKVAGGYLTIENRGAVPDRLLSAVTTTAKKMEIHDMAVNSGVMTMRPIDGGLTIGPGETARFAPGGRHLMFLGLNEPLKQGQRVPVTLTFEHAGEVKVSFDVQSLGAQAPAPERQSETSEAVATPVTSDADESFFTHLHAVRAMANVTVSPGRAGPVEIAIQLEDAEELPLSATAVSVTLGNSEAGIEPVTADAERVGLDQWRVRMSAPVSGRWSLGLGITISASDSVKVVSPILIK